MSKQNKQPDFDTIDKGIRRQILIDNGQYNIHKAKVVPSGKDYTRKIKHKNRDSE